MDQYSISKSIIGGWNLKILALLIDLMFTLHYKSSNNGFAPKRKQLGSLIQSTTRRMAGRGGGTKGEEETDRQLPEIIHLIAVICRYC